MTPFEAARRLVAAADDKPIDEIKILGSDFFQSLGGASAEESSQGLAALSEGIQSPNTDAAALIAMMCGALIERGAPGELIADPLLARLGECADLSHRFFDKCKRAAPSDTGLTPETFDPVANKVAQTAPVEFAGWQVLQRFFAPAVAMFSTSPMVRKRGRSLLGNLSEISGFHGGAHWLTKILCVLHNEPYVAIEPAAGLGIEGRMSGISGNFQLNVLLMHVFPGATQPRVPAGAVEVALGHGSQQGPDLLKGHWNLCTWQALRGDCQLPDPKDLSAKHDWIWNEGVPADIPVLSGFRVILLSPPAYNRTWKSQRDFLKLPAELTIDRQLDERDLGRWLQTIRAAKNSGRGAES